MKKIFYLLTCLFLLTSCSSYVSRMHNQIDHAKGIRKKNPRKDNFGMYRGGRFGRQAPRSLSSKRKKFTDPRVKRKYRRTKRHYSAEDLVDNNESGSLWSGSGQGSFLFSKNNFKRNGDIVIIQVQSDLKNEIAAELSRAFPKPLPKEETGDKKEGEDKKPVAKKEEPKAKKPKDAPGKVYDKISAVVIEEINKDHLLVRGRKDLLYNRSKRTVEVQALVSRRDILDDDTVDSQNVLESSVHILR